jgi:hypothetical protein
VIINSLDQLILNCRADVIIKASKKICKESSNAMDFLTDGGSIASPIIDKWPLMSSPLPMLTIFGIYLVLVLKVGPEFMKTREPMNLTNFTRIYDISQVFICTLIMKFSFDLGFKFNTTWQCLENIAEKESLIEYKSGQWWFLMLRLAELIETVVFVLRKKQNQVSTLHIYHHISTATVVWIFIKYCTS